MSGRPSSSPSPWRSGSSGPSTSSGAALRRALSLVLRFAAAYGAIYLAWLPLQKAFVRLLAASAGWVLWALDRPRLLSGLTPRGNEILLESYLSGRLEPMASWGAENLHIFVVASLALILAAPAGGWRRLLRRLSVSSLLIFLYTLALTAVQIKTVAERYAQGSLRLTLTSHAEKVFLNWANRGLIMVGMLALPAFLFLLAYLSSWRPAGGRDGDLKKEAPAKENRWRKWTWIAATCALAVVAVTALAVSPVPQAGPEERVAGLRRITALNPSSPQASFSLALQFEDQGRLPESRTAYETSLRLDPNQAIAWYNLANVLFKLGEYAEAGRSYGEVLSRDPGHAAARSNLGNVLFQQGRLGEAAEAFREALAIDERRAISHKNLGETLLHLGRACEALPHLVRSTELDRGLSADPHLLKRIRVLESGCGAKREAAALMPAGK